MEQTIATYYKIKEDNEKEAQLEEGDDHYWNNKTKEELHNKDNMMEA